MVAYSDYSESETAPVSLGGEVCNVDRVALNRPGADILHGARKAVFGVAKFVPDHGHAQILHGEGSSPDARGRKGGYRHNPPLKPYAKPADAPCASAPKLKVLT